MQASTVPRAPDQDEPSTARFRTLIVACAALIWMLGLVAGVRRLHAFESDPGAIGATPPRWPTDTRLTLDSSRSTLIMFIHPQCSCSRATLSELRELLDEIGGTVAVQVIFVQSDDSLLTANRREAQGMPGVRVLSDPRGEEAVRFGALTSGHGVAYSTAGVLLFAGGITGARGHAGKNMGREQLLQALRSRGPQTARHAVFGCPLADEDRTSARSAGRG